MNFLVPKCLWGETRRHQVRQGFSSRLEKSGLSSPIIKDTTVFGGRIDRSGRLRMCAVALITKKWGSNRPNILHPRAKNCNEYFGRDSGKLSAFEDRGITLAAGNPIKAGTAAGIDGRTEVPRNRISKRGWLIQPGRGQAHQNYRHVPSGHSAFITEAITNS